MLDHVLAQRAPLPQNKHIALDPLALSRRDYDRPATIYTATPDDRPDGSNLAHDAITAASPFCNPEF